MKKRSFSGRDAFFVALPTEWLIQFRMSPGGHVFCGIRDNLLYSQQISPLMPKPLAGLPVYSGNALQQLIENAEVPLLLEFVKDSCGPCQSIAPYLIALAEHLKGKGEIIQVRVEENPELSEEFQIHAVPAFLYFYQGKLAFKHIGGTTLGEMKQRLLSLADS